MSVCSPQFSIYYTIAAWYALVSLNFKCIYCTACKIPILSIHYRYRRKYRDNIYLCFLFEFHVNCISEYSHDFSRLVWPLRLLTQRASELFLSQSFLASNCFHNKFFVRSYLDIKASHPITHIIHTPN